VSVPGIVGRTVEAPLLCSFAFGTDMFLSIELPMMTAGDVEWASLSGSLTVW
jgi:hypothetical protein